VKDDSTCLCADLVAATHGRGFWILDDVTPLRQAAKAAAARGAYLYAPAPAVRVRFATNDPTPWPPELPAGENPPPGASVDYYLPNDAAGPVTLDVLDAAGRVVRRYSSLDTAPNPDPGRDPAAYNRLCQQRPNAPHCDVPLYWAAPAMAISTRRGMHRVWWDMHYEPIASGPGARGGDDATGVVPHRSYPDVNAPWAPPGRYAVRLTVGGTPLTQPLVLHMDPRVRTPPAALAQLATLSRETWDAARAADSLYTAVRGFVAHLDSVGGTPDLKTQAEAIAPAPSVGRRVPGPFGPSAPPAGPPTLSGVRDALVAAAMAMQGADVAPTADQVAATRRALGQFRELAARWTALRGKVPR
jgi:hypothetical protein